MQTATEIAMKLREAECRFHAHRLRLEQFSRELHVVAFGLMYPKRTFGNHYEHMAHLGCLLRGERDLFMSGWHWRVSWRKAKRLTRMGWKVVQQ